MSWPVAHTYGHEDRGRISLPVGGIGTGTVGFGGAAASSVTGSWRTIHPKGMVVSADLP